MTCAASSSQPPFPRSIRTSRDLADAASLLLEMIHGVDVPTGRTGATAFVPRESAAVRGRTLNESGEAASRRTAGARRLLHRLERFSSRGGHDRPGVSPRETVNAIERGWTWGRSSRAMLADLAEAPRLHSVNRAGPRSALWSPASAVQRTWEEVPEAERRRFQRHHSDGVELSRASRSGCHRNDGPQRGDDTGSRAERLLLTHAEIQVARLLAGTRRALSGLWRGAAAQEATAALGYPGRT